MKVVGHLAADRWWRIAAGVAVLAAVVASTIAAAVPASAAKERRQRGARSWAEATNFRRPTFRPRRTIDVATASAFWRAWRRLRPGWEIRVHHVVFRGETIFSKRLPDWAEVRFDRGTVFTGSSDVDRPAVWIDSSHDVRFYGGTVTNPHGGGGMLIYDSDYVTWWNFRIRYVGGSGLAVQGIHTADSHLDLRGAISHWGGDLALDPHQEKGTGLHGALLGDADRGVRDSRFSLYLHDGPTGAGLEVGGATSTDGFWDNTLYVRCKDLTMRATVQAGGNCVQVWGENVIGNDFAYLDAEDIQGRPYDTSGMYEGQSLASDTVAYGRATHTNLNPALPATDGLARLVHWDRRHGPTVFEQISPRR